MPWPASNNLRFWNRFSLGILLLASAACIFLCLFIAPKFEQIFADALPGRPLPGATLFVIAARYPLALIALAWPVVGMVLMWRNHPAAILVLNLGILWGFLEIVTSMVALSMPMTGGLITGMPDAPSVR